VIKLRIFISIFFLILFIEYPIIQGLLFLLISIIYFIFLISSLPYDGIFRNIQ